MSAQTETTGLAERLRAIRESIRQNLPTPPPAAQSEPLAPIPLDATRSALQHAALHAAELGRPNPRPAGMANEVIQAGKSALARSLDWMLRPQREFNEAALQALDSLSVALEKTQSATREKLQTVEGKSLHELQEIRSQLRELSDLVTQRLERSEAATRDSIRDLRWSYEGALSRHLTSVEETRRRLNEEVRELNRRLAAQAKAAAARPAPVASTDAVSQSSAMPATPPPVGQQQDAEVDYFALEKDFRGTEEEIKSRQSFYLPYFKDRKAVLDIACGRGEFLELMRQLGVPASGVDLDADMVGRCLEKGLRVTQADVFQHLAQLADGSLDGVFCSQFVEHLPPASYSRLVVEAARKLAPGGVLAIETQNPECLAIFAKSFYIDPTHVKPIPAAQMRFLFEQAGIEQITTHYLSPAARQLPLIATLEGPAADAAALRTFNKSVENFNAAFFGGMDYAIIGRKPGGQTAK